MGEFDQAGLEVVVQANGHIGLMLCDCYSQDPDYTRLKERRRGD